MLLLRKALLSTKFYVIVFLLTILITGIRLFLPKISQYNLNSKSAEGIVTKIEEQEEYYRIYIKNKETVIINSKTIPKIELGDQIKITGTFQEPSPNTTKYLFNYQKYCNRNHIFYIVKADYIQITKKNHNLFYKLKNKIKKRVGKNAYLNTFLLGDKTYLSKKAKESYQENGVSHLFAISGMHIALLAKIIEKILKKRKLQEETIFKITSIFLILYLFLVVFSPSILRGVLFYIGFSMNRIYYFYISPKNLFGLLLCIALLINPNALFDTGFQYSYLISFSLISCRKEIESKNYFLSLFKVSILSFLVSIPITSFYFYQVNILSLLYNLIFVPLVSLIVFPLSLIIFILKPLEPIYLFLVHNMENLSIFFSQISFGKILLKRVCIIIYILYFLLLLGYFFQKKSIYWKCYVGLFFFHIVISFFDFSTYVEFLDVGQGDSTFMHLSGENVLIDTGGKTKEGEIYTNLLKPYFKSRGIHTIHFLILTHGDKDHMGDALSLVKDYKVETVIINCGEINELEKELIKALEEKKIEYYTCINEIELKKNTLVFLNTKLYNNENDNSNVIYTEINNYKFLLMGDAGKEREKDILEEYEVSNIDVLKVGHHGSNTSSSKEFMEETKPKYSIISVGENNRYGHPNPETITILKGTNILRTDQNGSILLKIKNKKLKFEIGRP